ncbi:MAG: alpha/beta hydrolase [Gemmatimonadota bacterium]|nr:alpha/beta hydrolase [Gemmatimonadota bacterium]
MGAKQHFSIFTLMLALAAAACAHTPERGVVTWAEIERQPVPAADHRIAYGSDSLHFGELRLPRGPGPHPLVVVIHGGCWRSQYNLEHISSASAALTRAGYATWTLEYRRIGNPGGGWPGTFQDVAQGTDYVRALAQRFPLDLDRVVLMGHSAGGHLALWLAARRNLPRESVLRSPDPLPVRGVVSLAGITDLRSYGAAPGSCNAAVAELMGGTSQEFPDRYLQGSPVELLPLGVPQRLLHGALDPTVPVEQSRTLEARARAQGDDAQLWLLEGAGHFDVIAPFAPAWRRVEEAVRSLLSTPSG